MFAFFDDGEEELAGWEVQIANYFTPTNRNATYEYDFGDDWVHKVTLEQIHPVEKGVEYPLCLAGRRACPPEDVGGVWGYMDMLDILNNPDHEDYEEIVRWLGCDHYDTEAFDPARVRFDDPRERLQERLDWE